MKIDPLTQYCADVQEKLRTGQATESSFRSALESLLPQLKAGIGTINEPKRVACGAPDLWVNASTKHGPLTVGYAETKDLCVDLDEAEQSEQLKRYRRCLGNLLLTNYLDFRWYVDGELRSKARLAHPGTDGKLAVDKADLEDVEALLGSFLHHEPDPITKPKDLAVRMARLTYMIRDTIIEAFQRQKASGMLRDLRGAFAVALIPDIDQPAKTTEFADMFAQTVAYGLFAARCNHGGPEPFRRLGAAAEIPKTNPLLRQLFETVTGTALNGEPFAGFVDDLVQLLDHTDIGEVLANFGKRTRREDPVVHFYETFLEAYDPALRDTRGIYYTPEPVVSYIVRSVDHLLKTGFSCPGGLADSGTVEYGIQEIRNGKTEMVKDRAAKVLILDPACGTGTFLYAVVDNIREHFIRRREAGIWPGYVRNDLLPRLFGFEVLMAPYAVAHFKLGMELAGQDMTPAQREAWAYDFSGDERLGIYLTNTLEEAERKVESLFGPYRVISEEANAAAKVKKDLPILVVMGNPPYSGHSANRSWEVKEGRRAKTFIGKLLDDYYTVDGEALAERNPKWLQDDYVKFIRWGQWRIQQTGGGVLAFITNHGYLDNPTFRGMRQQLMQAFDDIYVLDLHGSAKKKESCPDGSKDENVFDIQQGVAISIFVKYPNSSAPGTVRHAELWGLRERKYAWLVERDIACTKWKKLSPGSLHYLFVPQDTVLLEEYEQGRNISDVIPVNSVGVVTSRDALVFDFEEKVLRSRIADLLNPKERADRVEKRLLSSGDKLDLNQVRAKLKNKNWQKDFAECLYRPFDVRFLFCRGEVIERSRLEVMRHMLSGENLGLIVPKRVEIKGGWQHCFASRLIVEHVAVSLKTIDSLFPLYYYPDPTKPLGEKNHWPRGKGGRVPNLDPKFIRQMEGTLALKFVPDGCGDLKKTFGSEDVFHYLYAVLYSPTYRERYSEFLKMDFPRIPLTSEKSLFRKLCTLGADLVALHLMEDNYPAASWNKRRKESPFKKHVVSYPIKGSNSVEKGYPKYIAPDEPEPGMGKPLKKGRIYINADRPTEDRKGQYFDGIPEQVWEFHVGAYQVCEKWVKDRRGRFLSYEDLRHYQRMIAAIAETMKLMKEIDGVVPGWPLPMNVSNEATKELLEIPGFIAQIQKGEEAVKAGRTKPWCEARKNRNG